MAGKRLAGGKRTRVKTPEKKIRFQFLAPEAREVFIAGEFNHWDIGANAMKKDKDGLWETTLSLKPGRYEYRFFTDGRWENDASCSDCVPNDFGSFNCVRIVE